MKHYVIYQADTNKSTGSKILFRSLESIKKEGIALTLDAYKKADDWKNFLTIIEE